jgi:hypothetical protein
MYFYKHGKCMKTYALGYQYFRMGIELRKIQKIILCICMYVGLFTSRFIKGKIHMCSERFLNNKYQT